eukprot:COSAG05_NODE_8_length_40675_cov_148.837539_8_plen_382_part_00
MLACRRAAEPRRQVTCCWVRYQRMPLPRSGPSIDGDDCTGQQPTLTLAPMRAVQELATIITASFGGDKASLDRLETNSADAGMAATALSLLQVPPGSFGPPTQQFASAMVVRYCRAAVVDATQTSALCQQALQLGLSPPPGTRQNVSMNLLTAAAAAASRLSADAIAFVHAQALARHTAACSGSAGAGSDPDFEGTTVALKLLRLIAEECARETQAAADHAALGAIRPLARPTLEAVATSLSVVVRRGDAGGSGAQQGGGGAAKAARAALSCLQQWVRVCEVKIEDAVTVHELLPALLSMLSTNDGALADGAAESLAAFLPQAAEPGLEAFAEVTRALSSQLPRLDFRNPAQAEVCRALTRLGCGLSDLAWPDRYVQVRTS